MSSDKKPSEHDYSSTLFLPETNFPMRAGLPQKEPEILARWQKEGLYLKFLPPYCPELNLIEILWRKIKYEWLPLDAYQSFKTMTEALFEVIGGIGSKYRITFA